MNSHVHPLFAGIFNDFAKIFGDNSTRQGATITSDEIAMSDERERVTIALEDDGDDDRSFWQYEVRLMDTGEVLHVEPVNKHEQSREKAYRAAAEWANDNGFRIESR